MKRRRRTAHVARPNGVLEDVGLGALALYVGVPLLIWATIVIAGYAKPSSLP